MTTSFHYRTQSPTSREQILLLLHGTGGDENSLFELGASVAPGAGILSPRGTSLDEGFPRWFRRKSEGVFDLEDLAVKTRELAAFLKEAVAEHGWERLPLDVLGYSNGANMAASLLLSGTGLIRRAVLLRPMVPFRPEVLPDLGGSEVLIQAGEEDQICSPFHAAELAQILESAGAVVHLEWRPCGHGLIQPDVEKARDFFAL